MGECKRAILLRSYSPTLSPSHSQKRKERESNPQGSSLGGFRDHCHRQLACPSGSRESGVRGRGSAVLPRYFRDRCKRLTQPLGNRFAGNRCFSASKAKSRLLSSRPACGLRQTANPRTERQSDVISICAIGEIGGCVPILRKTCHAPNLPVRPFSLWTRTPRPMTITWLLRGNSRRTQPWFRSTLSEGD